MLTKLSFLVLLTVPTSMAQAGDTLLGVERNRLTAGVPVEVDVVGFAVGVHPEVLWRPFSPSSGLRLRLASALKVGSEYTLLAPLSAGLRWVSSDARMLQLGLGAGVQWKAFLVPDSGAHQRLDMYWEAALNGKVGEVHRVGIAVVPEFGLANMTSEGFSGTFGLGLALRATWSMRLQ